MDINQAHLKQNIARIRRDIRKTSREMQALVDADLDCTGAARLADLAVLAMPCISAAALFAAREKPSRDVIPARPRFAKEALKLLPTRSSFFRSAITLRITGLASLMAVSVDRTLIFSVILFLS